MDGLNIEEMGKSVWHCPACQGGLGATKWYSTQDLIQHSKKVEARRMKAHRGTRRASRGTTAYERKFNYSNSYNCSEYCCGLAWEAESFWSSSARILPLRLNIPMALMVTVV
ncbi:hypothetical protein COLO4_30891 [Corchorus olitorius]|uniref:Uncharacterized protein n=1 Tax=Corchorus olitorius TaxID=93759 RepID=A0A1R3H6L8_9ROSI|nr:hypothetical protein COLO4_30891 [Corchorus olitorius]